MYNNIIITIFEQEKYKEATDRWGSYFRISIKNIFIETIVFYEQNTLRTFYIQKFNKLVLYNRKYYI
jgi:hypothetical protein